MAQSWPWNSQIAVKKKKALTHLFIFLFYDTPCDTLNGLDKQHLNHPKNVIFGHLNISSVRDKFSGFKDLVLKETDTCLLTETKIDDSFPNSQFFAEGYKMYRKDIKKMVAVFYYMQMRVFLGN